MPAHITRSRVAMTGAAVLALAVVTGCGSTKEPSATAPTTVAQTPTESATPSETTAPSETPSETTAPSKDADTSAAITKTGTTLTFGKVANVQVDLAGKPWIGGLKVTALEKAPKTDYKDLGVRDDAGTVYYLRYDVTYLSGKTKFPPAGSNVEWTKLHPVGAPDQRISLINISRFKKCTTIAYKDGGGIDRDEEELAVGETATNMCLPFMVDKGNVSQVVHTDYDIDKKEDHTITWK